MLRRFMSHKKGGRVVTSGQFLFKGFPGRVDTSGTRKTIKTWKLWKCDLPFKTGGRLDASLHGEARHEHGT